MITRSHLSPIGLLNLSAKAGRLVGVSFGNPDHTVESLDYSDHPDSHVLDEAARQLDEYFDGIRTRFDLPLAMMGSPFQLKVWSVLFRIPFGKTITYGDLARVVEKEGGARAVGVANAANPLQVVVPCHRVIGSDGSLTGYAGGIEAKRSLLDLERAGAGLYVNALG